MRVEMLRTYSRKPAVSQYIEGVMQLCRLCLQTAETAVPIFADDPGDMCSSLALRIMICVGLDVKRDDHLPNLVCTDCCKELEQYYGFRKRCEVSYQKLKSHLLATQHRTTTQAVESIAEDSEILNDISINQDENMNINEFEVMIEAEASKVVPEPVPVISDVQTVQTIQTVKAEAAPVPQECRVVQAGELRALLTSLALRLGLAARRGGALALRRPARLLLHAADGALLRLQLLEEDIEETEPKDAVSAVEETPVAPVVVPKTRLAEPKPKKAPKSASGAGAGGGVRCAACGRVLASRSALRRHARTHSGERPYACPSCRRAFAQKEVMLRHMLVHQEVRPHQCARCDKSFTQRNALALHERSHLPPHERALALHSCPHCPKLFLYASGLSRHMMTHSGRVYVCGACRRQFADKSSVLRHHRARHAHLQEPAEPDAVEPEAGEPETNVT